MRRCLGAGREGVVRERRLVDALGECPPHRRRPEAGSRPEPEIGAGQAFAIDPHKLRQRVNERLAIGAGPVDPVNLGALEGGQARVR